MQAIDHVFTGSEFAPEQTIIITGINDEVFPYTTELYQNYPNPFNPETKIKYSISKESYVELKIFDITGSEVISLVNEKKNKGFYEVSFNGIPFTSGMYFYQLMVDNKIVSNKKMIMLK